MPGKRRSNLTPKDHPKSVSKLHHKCVCDICLCGRHQCPKEYSPMREKIVPSSHIDYKRMKTPEFKTPLKNKNKNYEGSHYNPDYLRTTAQKDYQRPNTEYNKNQPIYDFSKRNNEKSPQKNSESFKRPATSKSPGIFSTEYKNSFPNKPVFTPYTNCKPNTESSRVINQRMPAHQNQSTYKKDYERFSIPISFKSSPIKPKDNIDISNNGNQKMESTYGREFSPKIVQQQVKPAFHTSRFDNSPYAKSNRMEPQDYSTSYKKNFQRPEDSAYTKKACPITYLPSRPRYLTPPRNHLSYDEIENCWN